MSQFEIKNDGSFLDQFLKLQGDPKSGSEAAAGDGQPQQAGAAEQAAGETAEATGGEDPNLQYQVINSFQNEQVGSSQRDPILKIRDLCCISFCDWRELTQIIHSSTELGIRSKLLPTIPAVLQRLLSTVFGSFLCRFGTFKCTFLLTIFHNCQTMFDVDCFK